MTDSQDADAAGQAALREAARMRAREERRPAPPMSEGDVGAYYLGPDGESVWRLVGYAASPTATLERVHPRDMTAALLGKPTERVGGVVGAPIFAGFRRLIPEGDG